MIIFSNGSWQTRSDCPSHNWLEEYPESEQPAWIIDDNSELAAKIRNTPCFNPIIDENGTLIDIEAIAEHSAEEQTAMRRAEITTRLDELDGLEIRPLAAMVSGSGTDEDRARLAAYEAEKAALRAELSGLED